MHLERLKAWGRDADRGFRVRGRDISRLESFSDAAFGFALTLLVVSQQVPTTYYDLLHIMNGFPAFALCFAALFAIWYNQYKFFRRYALLDNLSILLNAALLLVTLFYVYPLKFLATLVFDHLMHEAHPHHLDQALQDMTGSHHLATVFNFYFSGFAAVWLIFALLYWHAYQHRLELTLSPQETFETLVDVLRGGMAVGISLLSMLFMTLSDAHASAWGLPLYLLVIVGVSLAFRSHVRHGRRKFPA